MKLSEGARAAADPCCRCAAPDASPPGPQTIFNFLRMYFPDKAPAIVIVRRVCTQQQLVAPLFSLLRASVSTTTVATSDGWR